MTAQEFRELLNDYATELRERPFPSALKTRLSAISLDELRLASAQWTGTLADVDYERLDEYTAQVVTYSAEIDRTYDERLSRLLTFTLSLAGFSVAYLVAILSLPDTALKPTIWGAIGLLVTSLAVWVVSILAVDPYYSHRRLGWSPYYFMYNIGLKFHKPRLIANFKGVGKQRQLLSDLGFVMDVATYRDRLSGIGASRKALFLANAEQIVMLFHVTATKAWSLSVIQYVLLVGLVVGAAIYLIGLYVALDLC